MKCYIIFTLIWLTLVHNINARVIRIKGRQRNNDKSLHHLCNVVKDGSHIPYPNDCSKFIHCDKFHAFIKQCPDGTLFDTNLNICNHENVAICSQISKESEIDLDSRTNEILDEKIRGFGGTSIKNLNQIQTKTTIKPIIIGDDDYDYHSNEIETEHEIDHFNEKEGLSGRSDAIQNEAISTTSKLNFNEIELEANTPTPETTNFIEEIETTPQTTASSGKIDASSGKIDTTTEPIITTFESIDNTDIDAEPNKTTTETITIVGIEQVETISDISTTTEPIDTTTKPISTTFGSIDNTDIDAESNKTTPQPITIFGIEQVETTSELSTITEPIETTTEPIITTFESIEMTDIDAESNATTTETITIVDIEQVETTPETTFTTKAIDSTTEPIDTTTEHIDTTTEPIDTTTEPIITTFESIVNTDFDAETNRTTPETMTIVGIEQVEMTPEPTTTTEANDTTTKIIDTKTDPNATTSESIDDIAEPIDTTNEPITTTFQSIAISTDIEPMITTTEVIVTPGEPKETTNEPIDTAIIPDFEPFTTTMEPIVINDMGDQNNRTTAETTNIGVTEPMIVTTEPMAMATTSEPMAMSTTSEPTEICKIYFAGAGTSFGSLIITQQEKDEHLTYECVEANRCKDNREGPDISVRTLNFGAGKKLTTLINSAQTAKCAKEGDVCCAKQHVANTEPESNTEPIINTESENEPVDATTEHIDTTVDFELMIPTTEPAISIEIEPIDTTNESVDNESEPITTPDPLVMQIMLPLNMAEMISTKVFNYIKESNQEPPNDLVVNIEENENLLKSEIQIKPIGENTIKAMVKVPDDIRRSLKFHIEVTELCKQQNQVLFVKALSDIISRHLDQSLLTDESIKFPYSSINQQPSTVTEDELSKTTKDSVLSWILDAKKKDNVDMDEILDYNTNEIPLPYIRTENLKWKK